MLSIEEIQIFPPSGIPAGTKGVAPGPELLWIIELALKQWSQRTTGFTLLSGQELEVTMGLAGSRRWAAVKEPKPARVRGNMGHGMPVGLRKPSALRLPLLRNQQQMGGLNWVLVQNQHMAVA
jgi:hypothetical protein